MLFNRDIDKETLKILLQENKRLKRENYGLRESLEELQEYKDEYKGLIGELGALKEEYMDEVAEFESIEKEYRKELDKVKMAVEKA